MLRIWTNVSKWFDWGVLLVHAHSLMWDDSAYLLPSIKTVKMVLKFSGLVAVLMFVASCGMRRFRFIWDARVLNMFFMTCSNADTPIA